MVIKMDLKDVGLAVSFVGVLGTFGIQQIRSDAVRQYSIRMDQASYENYENTLSNTSSINYIALGAILAGTGCYFAGRVKEIRKREKSD